MRWRGGPAALTLGAVGVAVLAGCGSGGPKESSTSPLDAYLEEIYPVLDARSRETAMRVEEAIADCMADAGFEYRVDETAGDSLVYDMSSAGTIEFAEQFGYGESIPLEDGAEPMLWSTANEHSAGRDWNAAYVASLSDEAKEQYDLAYNGRYSQYADGLGAIDAGEFDPDQAGCSGRASAVYEAALGPDELAPVRDAVDDVFRRVEGDPRVVEATADWSACMADAGYPGLRTVMAAQGTLFAEIANDWFAEWGEATGSPLGTSDYDVVRTTIPEALAELRRVEVELAVADARCRDASGYREVRRAVELEVESEVARQYREDLEAWVAWARETSHAAD